MFFTINDIDCFLLPIKLIKKLIVSTLHEILRLNQYQYLTITLNSNNSYVSIFNLVLLGKHFFNCRLLIIVHFY